MIVAQQQLDFDAPKVVLVRKVVSLQAEREALRVMREAVGQSEQRCVGVCSN